MLSGSLTQILGTAMKLSGPQIDQVPKQ